MIYFVLGFVFGMVISGIIVFNSKPKCEHAGTINTYNDEEGNVYFTLSVNSVYDIIDHKEVLLNVCEHQTRK